MSPAPCPVRPAKNPSMEPVGFVQAGLQVMFSSWGTGRLPGAVPRNAEFYFLARAGMLDGRWLAEVFLAPEGISVPGLQQRGQARHQSAVGVPLRCVAVTPPAPRSGYSSSDIPLDDWNRYQLGLPPASR